MASKVAPSIPALVAAGSEDPIAPRRDSAAKMFDKNYNLEVSIAMGVPPNGWFIMANPTEMDDLGVPL